jgi:hypothetical protein
LVGVEQWAEVRRMKRVEGLSERAISRHNVDTDRTLQRNPNDGFHTPGLAGVYFLGARRPAITSSIVR